MIYFARTATCIIIRYMHAITIIIYHFLFHFGKRSVCAQLAFFEIEQQLLYECDKHWSQFRLSYFFSRSRLRLVKWLARAFRPRYCRVAAESVSLSLSVSGCLWLFLQKRRHFESTLAQVSSDIDNIYAYGINFSRMITYTGWICLSVQYKLVKLLSLSPQHHIPLQLGLFIYFIFFFFLIACFFVHFVFISF